MTEPILSIRDLRMGFRTRSGVVHAVNRLSYDVHPGETVAVVGESGSGKSAHARTIVRLLSSSGKVMSGHVIFDGTELLGLSEKKMRRIRGAGISMVFQDPESSLNPVLSVGHQIRETIRAHERVSKEDAHRRAVELLERVRLPDPEAVADQFPHQLSGGMRQRVMLAIAVACRPKLLLADEPTTALDVTVQAQILDLIHNLSLETGMAVVLITHDLGVVARYADRIVVMYAGRAVEVASAHKIFRSPAHPYTRDLLRARPSIRQNRRLRLPVILGSSPDMRRSITGCPYAPRCSDATVECLSHPSTLVAIAPDRQSACRLSESVLAVATERTDE